ALFEVAAWDVITELGHSRDDAAGEAFDKVARLLGLGYPGGAALSALAATGDDHGVALPWPMQGNDTIEFSFSGLKTAVAMLLQRQPDAKPQDVAATFERIAIGSLVEVTLRAAKRTGLERLVVAGGVAANRLLRRAFDRAGLEVSFPPPELATDNGAMIAMAAHQRLASNLTQPADQVAGAEPATSDAVPYQPLAAAPA
ncbi:MAG TPA: tRNA (adenosine(37)-N6)-threonylcarbamoyltransferase complex transferase subunit TsaD, partial [Trueperaceae bacterium]|nr:tRNA (adenosine(37)-N6)-threonylcarbamoyltransferase complex transferase subunit TsaD [Trueperaceae bacterium]